MTYVLIKRDLLERLAEHMKNYPGYSEARWSDTNELRALLDAPRQPEGEAKPDRNKAFDACPDSGCDWGSFWQGWKACHADAQRAIAELLDECQRLDTLLGDLPRANAELREECERLRGEVSTITQETELGLNAYCQMQAERDTLRQQLAERDAEIERLRVKLMTIASAEPGRHNIEWAKAMAATGNNESYAKWREAFDQRDKLAGLLRDERNWSCVEISCQRGVKDHCLCGTCRILRIDAALAEVNK